MANLILEAIQSAIKNESIKVSVEMNKKNGHFASFVNGDFFVQNQIMSM
jgi:hypothetical protein